MTETLPDDGRASLSWARRQGLGDAVNRFHYDRLTRDAATGRDRLLFGG